MRLKACLCCESPNLVTEGYLTGRYHTRVAKDEDPYAFLFKGSRSSELFAVVCADCGYVHPFARSPRDLASVVQKRAKHGRTLDISPSEGVPIRLRSGET